MDTRRLRRIGRGWQGAARARSAAYLRVREQHSRAATTPGVSKPSKRGHSSAGRAPALQAGGRRRSEEHTSELQSLMRISYAVFCLKKKKHTKTKSSTHT